MSRGMGAMQAEIIETIKTWRDQEYLSWRGGQIDRGKVYSARGGHEFNPSVDVVDMRAVAKLLAQRRRAIDCGGSATLAFSASFSRALKGLVKRGLLKRSNSNGRREVRFYHVDPSMITTNDSI